jgi:MFS family permease
MKSSVAATSLTASPPPTTMVRAAQPRRDGPRTMCECGVARRYGVIRPAVASGDTGEENRPAARSKRRGLLRVAFAPGDFRRLAAALTISQAGDWLYNVGLLVYIFDRTHSAGWVAAGTVVRLLPYVILGPIGGAIADRYDRRRVMVGSDLVRGACMLLLALVASTPASPVFALALSFLSTVAGTPYRPAVAKTTPEVIGEDDLAAANAVVSAIGNIAVVVGPAMGAALLIVGPPAIGFAVNGASFLLGAVAVARVRALRRATVAQAQHPPAAGVRVQLLDGARALTSSGGAVVVVAFVCAAEFVYGEMTVMLVLASQRKLGTGSEGYGYLLAALGVGGVLVVAFAARLASRPRVALALAAGLMCAVVPLSAIAFVDNPSVAFATLVVAGAGAIVVEVVSVTLLQRALPSDVLGRIFGIYDALDVGAILVGALVAPILVSWLGLDTALIVGGSTLPLLPLLGLPAMRRFGNAAASRAEGLAPTVDLLSRLGIFDAAPRASLELIAARAAALQVDAGTRVIAQGEPAQYLYVVVAGRLDVLFAKTPDDEPSIINTLGAGDYFGEIGLLHRVTRTATVRAVTESTLLRIDGQDFLDIINQAPAISGTLMRGISVRLARTVSPAE